MNRDTFASYHPIVNLIYFCFVIVFSMIFMHPVCLAISLVSSLAYSIRLNGIRQIKFNLIYMLPLMLVTAAINPAFNHSGVTILAYLPGGNPLTLESVVYGIAAAVMLINSVNWFSCWNNVMTTDKITYIFGRIIPSLSLIFSMTMRFVPRFSSQLKKVKYAQKGIGRSMTDGSMKQKLKNGMNILSIMITWSLENAVETADSMKSRGYGLKGRTAFSIFNFDNRDLMAMVYIMCCGSGVTILSVLGLLDFQYLPYIYCEFGSDMAVVFILYAALMLMPCILDMAEKRKWKRLLNSKM